MNKQCIQRNNHLIVPLVGDTLSEICLGMSTLATLIFKDNAGGESQLQLEEAVRLHHHGAELYLLGSRPGRTFDPRQLHPLLELIGASVVDARAHKSGQLEISFSGGSVLRVTPESDYEAWHFQYPRPGRPASGDINHFISIDGEGGRLIVSGS